MLVGWPFPLVEGAGRKLSPKKRTTTRGVTPRSKRPLGVLLRDRRDKGTPPGGGPSSTPFPPRQKCAKSISLPDATQSESFTRKPRRNELFRNATAKPVRVNCRPPDYTARGGLHIHIADGSEPWFGPARRLANPRVARTSGAPSCGLSHSPVPGPGHATWYSANVLWRPRFSQLFPHRCRPREPACPLSASAGNS